MNEKELQDLLAKVKSEAQAAVDQYKAETISKADFDTKMSAVSEQLKGLEEIKDLKELRESVKTQAAEIEKLKSTGAHQEQKGSPILMALKENSNLINDLRAKKSNKIEFEIKASQVPGDIADHTIGDRAAGIGQIPVRRSFMKQVFPVVPTNKEFVKYIDQETVVRDAKNVAHCAPSTHNTKLTWKERNIQITKVRDFVDVCVDMMDDYDFVEGEIKNLINSSVSLKVDNGLVKDDGVYPNLHSVDEAASVFDPANPVGVWTGMVDTPNIFDLIIAMSSQIIALGQDNAWVPDTVLWNTLDKYKSMLVKDANGQYLLPPFVVRVNNKEYTIDGMRVISNPLITQNTLYVFDSRRGTIYERKNLLVEMSYENKDNFEHETVTIKAYERLNLLIRNVNKNAFMKCTDVNAAIAAITKA